MSTTQEHVVVVGAGAAGHSAATTLRNEGYAGRLTVLHGEPHRPYNRTLVNKGVLPGLLDADQIALADLEGLDVEVVTATATSLDVGAGEVVLEGGERLGYSALVVATGSTPRPLPPAGVSSRRVVTMHDIQDATQIRELLGPDPAARSVTLLGAGFIGAETASYLADLGVDVHLVSRTALPLAAAVGDDIARRIVELHQDHVKTHFGHEVAGVHAGTDSVTVTLDDDTRLESELAVVAHGTTPDSGWARGGHPRVGDGIAVDDRLRSHDLRRVYAAGSVAVHASASGVCYRVDHWDAAGAQGAHVARTVMHDITGSPDPGEYVPATGFTLSLYRHAIGAYGVVLPGAQQRQIQTSRQEGILTAFAAESGALTALAGLGASPELLSLRDQLRRP